MTRRLDRQQWTLLDLMTHGRLFASEFGGDSWYAWRTFAAVLFGLPLADQRARAIAQQCLGRDQLPTQPAREAWLIVGRRGGKSRIAALLAVFLACFRTYRLAPGERGVVMLRAADRRQARVVFRYIRALITSVPMLAALIIRETRDALDLSNGITIEVHTASYRSTRGYSVVGAVLDEIAFWRTDDSADPDTETLNSVRPAMATVPGSILVAITSPHARRGEAYRHWKDYFGRTDTPDILVWQSPSRLMDPLLPESVVQRAYERDPIVAAAEWGAQWRSDVENFVNRDVLDAVVTPGRHELPPLSDGRYVAFVDPSGGTKDSMTLAIAHTDPDNRAVLDLVREAKAPFSPERVVEDFAATLKRYRIDTVTGDRYAGEWPREQFRKHGLDYELSAHPKSDIYRDLLPLLNSGTADLLDHPVLLTQLATLERRTGRGGRDSIDHAPNAHDDVANAAAGALVLAGNAPGPLIFQ
jgi:hypothetical protein